MKIFISVVLTIIIFLIPNIVENHSLEYSIDFEEVERLERDAYQLNEYEEFKNAIGFKESTNNYRAVSRSGNYWGKYQFGKIARREVNLDIGRSAFMSDSLAQETAFYELLCRNYHYLKDEINQFENYFINEIQITKSGILASAHLVGNGSVKNYLHSDGKIVTFDGNNTSLEEYMVKFGHYEFNLGCESEKNIITDYLVSKYK